MIKKSVRFILDCLSSLSTSSSSKRKRDEASLDEPSCKIRKRDEASLDEPSCKSRPKYDLFLHYSFEDIGQSFISHLHGALHRDGFTISDHTKLPVGQEVCSELLKAIQESEIFVLVFSKKYAFSERCLDELVDIIKCKDKKKLFPVFFNVHPSDVRKQDGLYFNKAFEAHTTNFDLQRVEKWKKALNDAGQLSGHHYTYGDEESFIRKIVKTVKTMQNPQQLYVPGGLVGIESQVEELISNLKLDLEDVTIVAVLGIGGIGKTTIAQATFNRIAAKFDASCFLGDIYNSGSPTSMVKLQKKLISGLSQNDKPEMIHSQSEGVVKLTKVISSRKVLLVLDDADNFDQLEALGINPKFFQGGSRIIVTTRDKQSLGSLSYVSYNTSLLNRRESIELFTLLTYKQDEPIDTHLVNEIAYYSSGLPLVLKVWSRHFRRIEKREHWPNFLKELKAIPRNDVQKKLKISYDSLTNRAKKLFLDIACLFDGMDKDLIVKVLQQDEESAFLTDMDIQCLADRCLVIISSYGILSMHHVISEMGQEIVRQENYAEPGHRTRLMNHKDVLCVLNKLTGTQSVESIRQGRMTGHIDAFRKMNNLRLLRLRGVRLCSDPRNLLRCGCDRMSPLSFPKLKYLEWKQFPMESINMDMCNVVAVRLERSGLRTLWKGSKRLKKLKILDVRASKLLNTTGNFIGLENLEFLDFSRCENLKELDSSVWCLDKLVKLDLRSCKRLERFPLKMELGKLPSLQELDLSGCKNIGFEDDEVIKHFMSSLKETHITSLKLSDCKICKVPNEVGSLTSLKHLYLNNNYDLRSLPNSLVQLDQLEIIELADCKNLQSIPDLPQSICSVIADGCVGLATLPSNMAELTSLLELNLSWSKCLTSLPSSMVRLTSLTQLDLSYCSCLTALPPNMGELTSLEELRLNGCSKLGTEDPECFMKLTGLTRLRILEMGDCNVSQVPNEIGNLVSLRFLDLSEGTFCSLPDSFVNLLHLCGVSIRNCSKLTSLPLLPPFLREINVKGCLSLDVMRSASIDELCGCPAPAVCNMNFPYYKIGECVLAEYGEASFRSRLKINISDEEEFPIWCHNVFRNTGQGEFMAPQHLHRNICGIILYLRSTKCLPDRIELQNKTKGTSCCLKELPAYYPTTMCMQFYPLDNTTLMVEAGDSLAIHFPEGVEGFVVCLICTDITQTTPINFDTRMQDYDHLLSRHHRYKPTSDRDCDLFDSGGYIVYGFPGTGSTKFSKFQSRSSQFFRLITASICFYYCNVCFGCA